MKNYLREIKETQESIMTKKGANKMIDDISKTEHNAAIN